MAVLHLFGCIVCWLMVVGVLDALCCGSVVLAYFFRAASIVFPFVDGCCLFGCCSV